MLQANTIVRLYLVVWKNDTVAQTLRCDHGETSITDRATGAALTVLLHMEARSGKRVQVVFANRLTYADGQLGNDGLLAIEMVPVPSTIPGLVTHKHTFELVFKDAAGNLFDTSGWLLSRESIELNWTLINYKGLRRIRRYGTSTSLRVVR